MSDATTAGHRPRAADLPALATSGNDAVPGAVDAVQHAAGLSAGSVPGDAVGGAAPLQGAGPAGQAANPVATPMDALHGVTLAEWQAQLAASSQVMAGEGASPLVLRGPRLYLRRTWQDEQTVRAAIAARVGSPAARAQRDAWAPAQWRAALSALFPAPADDDGAMDWQQAACAMAASQGFCIITGGPGTGKTTTVVKLLALLQAMALTGVGAGAVAEGLAPLAGRSAGTPLRIALAAPTGKAAARLGESISGALARLDVQGLAMAMQSMQPSSFFDEREVVDTPSNLSEAPSAQTLLAAIPTGAQTLHRLLGPRADSRHFWHHAHRPLPVDVLVVDEASMVDLDMMARLMQALPPQARLVLLGDKDQLASVEAGAVLGELCSRAVKGHFSAATADWLQAVTGRSVPRDLQDANGTALDQAVVMLRQSHRFGADSGIGQLAAAVNAGEPRAVRALRQRRLRDLQWLAVTQPQAPALAQLVLNGQGAGLVAEPQPGAPSSAARLARPQGHGHYLSVMRAGEAAWRARAQQVGVAPDDAALDAWALSVLQAQRQFQLLCALRQGAWGVEGLNRRIARWAMNAGLVQVQGSWWAGRPVMVTANDYGLGLMNGDIGVTLARPVAGRSAVSELGTRLSVAFAAPDRPGGVRWVSPSRLTQVDTVFAMTVHKSQGSEFTHAALVIPPAWNPVLTRELVYTGITRASHWCSLVLAGAHGEEVLELAVKRRVLRASGLLADALEGSRHESRA
ncbi:exodeoxyribonuclease V subunit alpha [Comamonas serinivorans]|uniref:RecBCD enzyme subunit RecD n=2 Tax=Comamonas serinivorans TaxID=1082851 RepID=A0A1Y0ET04_9BURK|nr:exodeoxyribonuclease V subunit alpha [Comamonas serinivorans]